MTGPDAASWLSGLLGAQLEDLRAQHVPLRRHDPEAVHDMRVAARRLRASLASYRRLMPSAENRAAREDLRWIGMRLSAARDAEVTRHLVETRLEAWTDDQEGVRRARAAVDRQLSDVQDAAMVAADELLGSPRYLDTFERLEGLVDDVGRRDDLGSAVTIARAAITAADRRLHRAVRHADRTDPAAPEGIAALHEVRKAAKRLRYVAEGASGLLGDDVADLAEAAKEVQTVLGDHRDTVVLRDRLRSIATASHDPDVAFTLGRVEGVVAGDPTDPVPGYAAARATLHRARRRMA